MIRPELLSPAGDFEKLGAALNYGADAVYLAGNDFGMRAASGNFTHDELRDAVELCHSKGKKLYVTVNVMPRTAQYGDLEKYLKYLSEIGVDAAIISDIGVFSLAREIVPELEIHISTQASAVSAAAVSAWYKMGAKRIVLARELTLDEIREIRAAIPAEAELECFIHGSMCVAYSGRCLLSQYFLGRDANQGRCAQPCRWIYNSTSGVAVPPGASVTFAEEKRPEEEFTAVADRDGTYIMSSRDMCMIDHIPELMEAGINSFKLEGRVRSAYYTAVVTNTYRMAIDAYMRSPETYSADPAWANELDSVSHRLYGTGFFFGSPLEEPSLVREAGYIREKAYLAVAVEDSKDGRVLMRQRNKLSRGDCAEILSPGFVGREINSASLYDENGAPIESAPHPNMLFYMDASFDVKKGDILRGVGRK